MAWPVVILQETPEEEIQEGETEAVEGEAKEEVANPILPTGNELIFGAAFFLVLWALMKFVLLPPVMKVMDDRDAKVRGDLDTADGARAQRETLVAEYEAALAAARAAATAEVNEAKAVAMAQLRGQVAGIATAAAEAVVQRPLDAGAQQLIDQYLSRSGSQN